MKRAVYAPVSGRPVALEDGTDVAFAEKLLGDGYAIKPGSLAKIIHSPVEGKIAVINSHLHAVAITSNDGLDILVHVGVDTVELNGEGFRILCKVGQKVSVGDPLIKADFAYIRAYATDDMVSVIVTNTSDTMVFTPASHREGVKSGDLLFTVE
ncbi:PTS sugar transporter subunit IIA [Entomospira culicis]|uniref:PTS system glucose-specific EIIA component n=1 Tax=Entomospira culicis TaxID=2719989 RepID=A0A968GGT3_9SPIO|nr:glucose PTS transporter subunit IIA [Entomospira culicis]NIZ18561.1 PTS glucose transporter subunit IIA [Entomospira culicis]NIZ68777.1 PTS glucose transporter subunit IIA [Entomospira culicis]WDI37373.1 glucose PTS transporter subunit IIA [Entomospira culicis]WDI39002.1 glucose PTS transporter subunit IIA [Entomospira culicis]